MKSPKKIAALAMVIGLSLLVYSLVQRALCLALATAGQTISNQLGQFTTSPQLSGRFFSVLCRFILFFLVKLNRLVILLTSEVTFFSSFIPIVVNIICSLKFFCQMWDQKKVLDN